MDMQQGGAAFRLRQQNRVWSGWHDGGEIGIRFAGCKAVDADQEPWPNFLARFGFQECRCAIAGVGFAVWRNRVLEIENDRVGAACEGLVELVAAVGRDEEERTHQRGLMSMKACRRHSATSLSFWL